MLSRLGGLYRCQKQIFTWPSSEDWLPVRSSHDLFATARLTLPLADASSVSIEGLLLILEFDALGARTGAAVLRLGDRHDWHLGRFDFGEDETHSNRRAIKLGGRGLPPFVRGTHCHAFGLNEPLGIDAFQVSGSLPAAVGISDIPPSFRQRMRLVSTEFNIDGLEDIPAPPLQGDLLR